MYVYALLKFCSASFVIRHIKYANYHLTFFLMETLLLGNNPVCVLWLFYKEVKPHTKNKNRTIIMSMFVCRIEEKIFL